MVATTVLLPLHNGARFVREAVESVLGQKYEDFELLVLDDASSDAGPAFVQSIRDPRLRFLRNPSHYGLFKTLNRGFEEARANLVHLWAQDDRMLPRCLGAFDRFATEHPDAGMIYSDFFAIDSSGNRTRRERLHAPQRQRTPVVAGPTLSALLFWCYGCLPGNISTVAVRRDAWRQVGGFLTGYQQAPDYDMWERISERFGVGFLGEQLVEIREHAEQLSRVGQKQMTTIEEELPVVRRLEARLAGVVNERDLRAGWRTERGRQHAHWIARALARGDLTVARRGVRAISAYGQPWWQFAFWLLSANGRFFKPSRESFFDAVAERARERDATRAKGP